MSKIDDLIKRLCPCGVEYKKVEEIANISRGRVISKDYIHANQGVFPVYSSQTENNGQLGCISTYDLDGEYLTWTTDGANAGSVFYRNGKFSITNVCGLIKVSTNTINVRFLFYTLSITAPKYVSRGMGNPKLMSNVMARIKIPVPPIEIQDEIVRILDNFTELTANLKYELATEFTARKKQYEYYRDSIIASCSEMQVEIGSLGSLTRGKRFVHADAVTNGVPCIHYGELYTHYGVYADSVKSHIREDLRSKMRYASKGDVIIVGAGENNTDIGIGVAWCGEDNVAVHDACYTLKHNQNPKYISYCLRTKDYHEQIKKYVSSGKICAISAAGISKAKIPLPPIEEQNRIVAILDRYDAIYTDISLAIPEEIEARQKQYEYYRDKLLTFKELSV